MNFNFLLGKKTFSLLFFWGFILCFSTFSAFSQTYLMGTQRTINGCSGTIYDNGGATGNYGTGRDDTMTIISNNASNAAVRITFDEQFDIDEKDTLYFYNGHTAHPDSMTFSIGSTRESWVNNSTTVSFIGTNLPSVTAEIPGSGAITMRFKSQGGTISLPVTINSIPTSFPTETINIYDVQLPFHYGDSILTAAGTYVVWFSCDSAISVTLNVTNTPAGTGFEEIYVCDTAGALPYDYVLNGQTYQFSATTTQLITQADTSVVVHFVAETYVNTGSFIAGHTMSCNGNQITTYIYTDIVADTFRWTYPNGEVFYGTENFRYNIYTPATISQANGFYSVSGYNACEAGTEFRDNLNFYNCSDTLEPQTTITGFDDVCENSTQTYTILGGDNYTWAIVPPTAGSIQSGQNTNTITVHWNNSGAGTVTATPQHTPAAGFKLSISCTAPCQPLSVYFNETLTTPTPHYDTTNLCGIDGYKYIDLCPGEPVTFKAYGTYYYPNPGYSYYQGDDSTTFIWKIGDETVEQMGATEITRTFPIHYDPEGFPKGQGYDISLSTKDQRGCISNNAVVYRVRTSADPIRDINFPPVCVDSTTTISVGYNASNFIQIGPVQDEQVSSLTVTQTIFLPDGANCPPNGYFYRSPVTFTSFSPTSKISSANDIRYVRVNMEHSFIGDIRISLECPNGQSVDLLPDYQDTGWPTSGSTGTWLGEANETDDSGDGCTGSQYAQGNGWNYCFSNNTDPELGYVYASSPNKYIYETANVISHNNPFHGSKSTVQQSVIDTIFNTVIDTSICYVMEDGVVIDTIIEYIESEEKTPRIRQAYRPVDNFFPGLNNCPLNGTWFIEVEDTWGIDNGFLFEWELALSPELLPPTWKYSVGTDTVAWGFDAEQLHITYVNDTILQIKPLVEAAGNYPINFIITDNFGCEYERTEDLIVNGLPNVLINNEINGTLNTCLGEAAELVASGGIYYLWNNLDQNDTIVVNTSGVYDVTATDVNGCENFDTMTVIIHDAPASELNGSTENCYPKLEIIPQAPIFCTSIQESGFDIYNEADELIGNNYQELFFTDNSVTEEGDYLYKVVSRYDNIHIPNVGDILCSDGTYETPTTFPTSGKTASGVLFWKNEGSSAIPALSDDYWIVDIKNSNPSRKRAWGADTTLIPIPTFTVTTANSDYAGQCNTDSIVAYTTGNSAALSCQVLNTSSDGRTLPLGSLWSLPAAGQMTRLSNVLSTVNNSLNIINGATQITGDELLWTSTQANTANAFAYNINSLNPVVEAKTVTHFSRAVASTPLMVNRSDTSYYTIHFRKPSAAVTATPLIVPIGGNTVLSVQDTSSYNPVECAPTQYAYEWKDPNGATISTYSIAELVNLTLPGNFTYTVTMTPLDGCSNGCSVTVPITISVRNQPVVEGDQIVCLGSTRSYSTASGKQNYSWRLQSGDGTYGSIESGANTDEVTINWNVDSGNEILLLSYSELNVQTDTTQYPITINPLPNDDVNLLGDGKYCSGGDGLSVLVENPQVNIWYKLYRNGEVMPAVPAISTAISADFINFGAQTLEGTYTVRAYTDNPDSNYNEDTCEIQLQDEVIIVITPNPPERIIRPE